MAKTAVKKKPGVTKKAPVKPTPTVAKGQLSKIAETNSIRINLGNLDPDLVITKTGKMPRVQHNLERVNDFHGKTVREALESRRMDARDIKYDVDKGFYTLESSSK